MNDWTPIADSLPDDNICVLIALADGEVWTGFIDAGEWRYVSADLIEGTVTHWMDFPAPPVATAPAWVKNMIEGDEA